MAQRKLRLVVGTQLRANVNFWTAGTASYVGGVEALMVSFAEMIERRGIMVAVAKSGLGHHLRFRGDIFLDNGSYTMLRDGGKPRIDEYVDFVARAKPDWFPVPVDYLPSPSNSRLVARRLAEKTARINDLFGHSGYVPVVHMGPHFAEYFRRTLQTLKPERIAVGGMVPYLRFGAGADPRKALEQLATARKSFDGSLHVFGFGGGITSLHLAAALGVDSVDSSGWRVRAARGFILVPGCGERMINRIGGWDGPCPSPDELLTLRACGCYPCRTLGLKALTERGRIGFENRAVHNLWILLHERRMLNSRSSAKLKTWSLARLCHNRMRYLVEHAFEVTRRGRRW
jgi:hypothetical protein